MKQKSRDGQWWVVVLNGDRTVVKVSGDYIYSCGDEQGWKLGRDDVAVTWIRRVRL